MHSDRRQAPHLRLLAIMVAIGALAWSAARTGDARAAQSAPAGQEMRFADQIAAFRDQDRSSPPPTEAILFIGSSIWRLWSTVAQDMAPLPVYNRAFGGSQTPDMLRHFDALVVPHKPRIIVYYCGSNDVNAGQPADAIAGRIHEFATRVGRSLPGTKMIFASTAPDIETLRLHGNEYGLPQLPAAPAGGPVDFVSTGPITVDTGAELRRADGVTYLVTAGGMLTIAGTLKVPVTSANPGARSCVRDCAR